MKTKITVSEASKLMGVAPMGLRMALRQGKFKDFGEAWKNDEKWTYYINKGRLEQYLNCNVPPVDDINNGFKD